MNQKLIVKHLTKDIFATFKKVRDLSSPLYGNYQLYSKNGLKYLCKHLSKDQTFHTFRNSPSHILRYESTDKNIYLFVIPGDPIFNLVEKSNKDSHEGQLKVWVQKCGSIENCLREILKLLIKLIEQKGLTQILTECLRVHKGELQYCFDTWMKPSSQIVLENPCELQNYYFSHQDLQSLKEMQNFSTVLKPTKQSLYFRVCLLILHLGTQGPNYRSYEYGQFQLHREHLKMKLDQFCSKYKSLGSIVKKVISEQQFSTEEIWLCCQCDHNERKSTKSKSIISSVRTMKKSGLNFKKDKQNQGRSSLVSQKNKIDTSFNSYIDGDQSNYLMLQKSEMSLKQSFLHPRDDNSSGKQNILLKSNNKSSITENDKTKNKVLNREEAKTYKLWHQKAQFNLKQSIIQLKEFPVACIKLLKCLNLQQLIPKNSYQQKILQTLKNVHITSNWIRQQYENGSIYLGETINGKKEGKGLYVFGSNDCYFGDWKSNYMDGHGTYVFVSGEVYEGEIKKGVKEGHGKCQYSDGRIYEGSWKKNSKIGLGKIKFPNDVTFLGVFKVNCNETQGLFLGPMNSENIPMWENKGILEHYNWQKNSMQPSTEPNSDKKKKLQQCLSEFYSERQENDGSHYEGQMVQGKKQGFGIIQSLSERYEGEWSNDHRQGYGILHVKGAFSIAGRWKDGLLVQYAFDEDEDIIF